MRDKNNKICKTCEALLPVNNFTKKSGRNCIPCHREYMRSYYHDNKGIIPTKTFKLVRTEEEQREFIKQKNKLYYAKNVDSIKEQKKEYYRSNFDIIAKKKKIHYKENLILHKNQCKDYYRNNIDRFTIRNKNYHTKNPSWSKNYRLNNKDKIRAACKKWSQNNKDICNFYCSNRRAMIFQSMPSWLTREDMDQIKQIYINCSKRSKETGISHQVDHIFPLKGIDSRGLHVPWNLRIITRSENISKNNKIDLSLL